MTSSIHSNFGHFSGLQQQACSVSWVRVKPHLDTTLDKATLAKIQNVEDAKRFISSIKCPDIKSMPRQTSNSFGQIQTHTQNPVYQQRTAESRTDEDRQRLHLAPTEEPELTRVDTTATAVPSLENNSEILTQSHTLPSESGDKPKKRYKPDMSKIKKVFFDAALKDVEAVHTKGHWIKDMRSIAMRHYLVRQTLAWTPPLVCGAIAATLSLTGATAATGGAAAAGVIAGAAVLFGIYAIFVKIKTWSTRESDKPYFLKNFTKTMIAKKVGEKLELNPQKNSILRNNFTGNKAELEDVSLKILLNTLPEEVRKTTSVEIIKTIISIVYGNKNPNISPLELTKFAKVLPDIINEANKLKGELTDEKINVFKQHLDEKNLTTKLSKEKKYSDLISKKDKLLIPEPITVTEQEYEDYLEAKNNPNTSSINAFNNKLTIAGIQKIISIKPVTTTNNGEETVLYRIYGAKYITNNDSQESNEDIEKQLLRILISNDEITWAKHGPNNSSKTFYDIIFNEESPLYNENISKNIKKYFNDILNIELNQTTLSEFLKNINTHKENIINNESTTQSTKDFFDNAYYFPGTENNNPNYNHIEKTDTNAIMSMNESDFLYYEKTGARNPLSSLGIELRHLKKAFHELKIYIQKSLYSTHNANTSIQSNFNPSKVTFTSLPDAELAQFNSTHMSRFHSHDYLKLQHDLNLIDYVTNKESDRTSGNTSEASRERLKKNRKNETKNYMKYSNLKDAITTTKKSDKNASFGPAESENSMSPNGALKRFNSSRELMITYASLFKLQETQKEKELTIINTDNKENKGNIYRNDHEIFAEMNHAMNIHILKSEASKVQASINDLTLALDRYTKIKNTLTTKQIKNLEESENQDKSNLNESDSAPLETHMLQKEIKFLIADLSDSMHSLFRTKFIYSTVYNLDSNDKPTLTNEQKKEMQGVFNKIEELSKDDNIQKLMNNTQEAILHNRSRALGSFNPFNLFLGRNRLPIGKRLTFKGTINRLLGKEVNKGFDILDKSLELVTEKLFEINKFLYDNSNNPNKTNTFENLEYIEGLTQ